MSLLKQIINCSLGIFGYRISRIQKESNAEYFSFTKFLNYYIEKHKFALIIQIGANDGVTFDPIRQFIIQNQFSVKAILLEPMKDVYTKLVENYKNFPNVTTENLAIHNERKEMIIYKVDPTKLDCLPQWAVGSASFNPEHHKLSKIPSEFVIQEKVNCITFNELIDKYKIKQLDLLQIDTEGYDSEIIKSIDFSTIKPSIIHFEHGYVDGIMNAEKINEIFTLLNKNGYQIIVEYYDATAYLPFKII